MLINADYVDNPSSDVAVRRIH